MSENTHYLWNKKLSNHTIWKAETVQSQTMRMSGGQWTMSLFTDKTSHKSNILHFKSKHAEPSHLTHAQSKHFKHNLPHTLFCFLVILWVQLFFFFGHWIISTSAGFWNSCATHYSMFSEVQTGKKTEFYRIFGPTFQVLLHVDLPVVIPT